jgi:hypothetical protein
MSAGRFAAWLPAVLAMVQDVGVPGPEKREPIEQPDARDPARPAKIALFRVAGFPTVDAPEIPLAVLDQALEGLAVDAFHSPQDLKDRLKLRTHDVLVLPHGSAFPLHAWGAIRAFLERGGGLVVLGGAPFHQPVRWLVQKEEPPEALPPPTPVGEVASAPANGTEPQTGSWALGARQPTFAHELLIAPAEAISPAGRAVLLDEAQWRVDPGSVPSTVFELTVRFATRKDFEREDGSAGPRDAVLRPLVQVVDANGIPRACPLLEIDRLRGSDAGARWVFASSDATLSSSFIRECVKRALEGAGEIEARPFAACVEEGESPRIRVTLRRPFVRKGETVPSAARVTVRASDGREVFAGEVALAGPPEIRTGEIAITRAALSPGLYRVEVRAPGAAWRPASTTTGFWVRDAKLLASGPRLSVSRDWLRRDGGAFPIVGTTYMASDVHRKFLFEPNPHRWDLDFARMASAGVNFVRTGLWTGWSRAMLDPGAVDEGVLRALDAFVLTAARHGIVLCFNFFAFLPPAFGGTNPYLDPRALEGQKAFLTAVARRYRDVPWIHYDLINEPSYAPPEALWQNRPILDDHEKRAWTEWVRARHGDDPLALRDLWRDSSSEILSLPKPDELSYAMVREHRRPRKALDFAHFTHQMVARWAGELRETLRAAGGDVLVTLGQDEGGTWLRPSQQIYATSVDYTAVHTWWNNDDLLWDGVATKVPEKPSLIQETGLMRLEDIDGMPWRTPDAAAALLERKFAFAFASRGAGAVEWAWNVNPYQPIDNEAVIGLWRPDGTAKVELAVIAEFAAFFREAAPWLDDFEPDPVVVVLPHSRLFAGRPFGMDAVKQVTRVLAEHYAVVPTAISELLLTAERLRDAKLVLVPVPEMLEEAAARALLQVSRAGTKVLITGAVEGDPYGRATESLQALGILDRGRPLALREPTRWSGWATFDGNRGEYLRRSGKPSLEALEGNVWHEPLPLELARQEAPLIGLLGEALAAAGVESSHSATNVSARVLKAPRAALVVCVNETSVDAVRRVSVEGRAMEVAVPAGRAQLLLVERASGRVLARLRAEPASSRATASGR